MITNSLVYVIKTTTMAYEYLVGHSEHFPQLLFEKKGLSPSSQRLLIHVNLIRLRKRV
jgi:hypothetical protein